MTNDKGGTTGPSAFELGHREADPASGQTVDELTQSLNRAVRRRDAPDGPAPTSDDRQRLDGFVDRTEEELWRSQNGRGPAERTIVPLPGPAPSELYLVPLPDEPSFPRRPDPCLPANGWTGPDFLFTGFPNEDGVPRHRVASGDDREAAGQPSEDPTGLGSLFTGWTEGIDKANATTDNRPAALRPPPDMEAPEFLFKLDESITNRAVPALRHRGPFLPGERARPLADPIPRSALDWVEPKPSRTPLRARLQFAREWFSELFAKPSTKYQDWDE